VPRLRHCGWRQPVSESELYAQILKAVSTGNTRLFRQQSGQFWTGRVLEHSHDRVVLAHPRIVRVGALGMSDLGGVTSVIITPDMVGHRVGIDVQIEVKSKSGRISSEQQAYIDVMRQLGSRAGTARSVDEATAILVGEQT
jgi:VRR-NUC domain